MIHAKRVLSGYFGLAGLLLLVNLLAFSASGQTLVSTLSIQPPFTASLSDYADIPNKVMVSLLNNNPVGGTANVYFKVEWVYLPEKFSIITSYKPASPISVIPYSMKTLSPSEVKSIFSPDHLQYFGITKQEVLANGLPEGTYRVCVRAFDFNTNNQLSIEGTGCMVINILNSEPPTVLSPYCGDSVKSFLPQQIIFSWTPPTGVSLAGIRYSIRMAEVSTEGTDPHQAMASATYPYFYELKDIAVNTFIYGPAQPALTKGKTYAFTISVYDPQGKMFFKNNGASEVCWFKYGNTDTTVKKKQPTEQVDTSGKLTTTVSGKLFYSYSNDPNQTYVLKNTQISLKVKYYKKGIVGGKTKYTSPSVQPSLVFVMTAKKTQYESVKKRQGNKIISNQENPGEKVKTGGYISTSSILTDLVTEMYNGYTTTTNNNGEFAFIIKLSPDDTADWIPDPQNPSDKLYKTYCIELFNPYFENPALNFQLNPGEIKELGSVIVPVRTYNLNVNVQQVFQGNKGKFLDGMVVFVLRKNKNSDLPEIEGDASKNYPKYFGYTVVAKANTTKVVANKSKNIQENSITFNHLVANLMPGDEYVLYAAKAGPTSQSDFSAISNYASDKNSDQLQFGFNPSTVKNPPEVALKTLYCVFQNPPVSTVTGYLKYQYPDDKSKLPKPLKNIKVSLVVCYKFTGTYGGKNRTFIYNNSYINNLPTGFKVPADNGLVLKTVYTGVDGRFSVDFYNLDSLKVVNNHFSSPYSDVTVNYSGKLERVIRLVVQSPFYCSPDEDIKVQPWTNYDAGILYSSVMSYNLKVKVKLDASFVKSKQMVECNPDSSISGVTVSLYRKYYSPDIPTDEGQGINKAEVVSGENLILVAQGVNETDGSITFNNCIRSSFIDDHYEIRAFTPKKSGSANFMPLTYYYPGVNPVKRQQEAIMLLPPEVIVFNSEYNSEPNSGTYYTRKNYSVTVGMQPRNPRIDGRVISVSAPNGVKIAIVTLNEKSVKTNSTVGKYTLTDTSGYFSFENLNAEFDKPNDPSANIIGPDRSLKIIKNGYKEYNQPLGIMKLGFSVCSSIDFH